MTSWYKAHRGWATLTSWSAVQSGQRGFASATDVNRLHADHETIEYSSHPLVTPGRCVPGVVTGGAIDYVTMT